MTSSPDESERPEYDQAAVDAAFTEIADRIGPLGITAPSPPPPSLPPELNEDDEPFVPAEPDPIPRPQDTLARFAWAGVLGAPLLAILVYLLSLPRWLATLASVAFVAGFVVLIWRRVDERDEYDDGARL